MLVLCVNGENVITIIGRVHFMFFSLLCMLSFILMMYM